jgi:hypothetical protein
MAFRVANVPQNNSGEGSNVDFDAINRYVVETAGLEDRETVPGIISSIVDLGIQKQPDAETTFTGDADEEAEIIAKFPDTYFKDGVDQETKQEVRLKCWPQKPVQCVALSVDFPDIVVDKGQFFDESKPLPLRLYLGGQFYIPGQGMIVARPTPLRVVNLDKTRKTKKWSLAQNNILHKMAVAAKLIKADEVFLPQDIDKLLGKAFQFDAQVFFKKSGSKEYYTEYVKFATALGRGQSIGELEVTPYIVEFDGDNEDEAIKGLRSHVVNTIKQAENFAGSKIAKQIEALRGKKAESAGDSDDVGDESDTPEPEAPAKPKPAARKPAAKKEPAKVEGTDDNVDGDLPW